MPAILSKADRLCPRCEDLDVVNLLRTDLPWNSPETMQEAWESQHPAFRHLGKAGSVVFRASCPLCVCLFTLAPTPSSSTDDLFTVPDWTYNRLAGHRGYVLEHEEKRKYAKCLTVFVEQTRIYQGQIVGPTRGGEALCILDEDLSPDETLGGRHVQEKGFNVNLCKAWLDRCRSLHEGCCEPRLSDELRNIRLVDIEARQVVAYPGSPCDYAALSYVWGGSTATSYRLGSRLIDLPRTIEQSMHCARELGKKYLWVDALCIDQFDEADKNDQILRMWDIYGGASVTIFALSSISADYGLIGPSEHVARQMRCVIDGKRFVGLGLSLEWNIWRSRWGSRAWTFQEAVLSRRRLYLGKEQTYFECEVMQCSESLDESRSPAHILTPAKYAEWTSSLGPEEERLPMLDWFRRQNGEGVIKGILEQTPNRFHLWDEQVSQYSGRTTTIEHDFLRAFSGILRNLTTFYEAGFFWGLPLEDLNTALLWYSITRPRERRHWFPSWSWCGWHTVFGSPTVPRGDPPWVRIWRARGEGLECVCDRSSEKLGDDEPVIESSTMTSDLFPGNGMTDALRQRALYIEVMLGQLQVDGSYIRERAPGFEGEWMGLEVGGVTCQFSIWSLGLWYQDIIDIMWGFRLLVLAQDIHPDHHHLLMLVVCRKGECYIRKQSVTLAIPVQSVDQVMPALRLHKERIVLI